MSCNPSIGGVGKGQLVREIDALGGIMARAADASSIQFRMLNTSKGPAVWSPRSQIDRTTYTRYILSLLDSNPNIRIFENLISDISIKNAIVTGVFTSENKFIPAESVILCAGTFLSGVVRIGDKAYSAGRQNDPAADKLAVSLGNAGLPKLRFKTGTPARLAKESIDFTQFSEQCGDPSPGKFSFFFDSEALPQVCCWNTQTSLQTKQIVLDNLSKSALYGGYIEGRGPRYCPSIEDKYVRFSTHDTHHLFLEPEGLDSDEIYLNGLSNSMPEDIQLAMVHSVKGLEKAEIRKFAYAIEYDCYNPQYLEPWLESRILGNFFIAGQVNGTSGYEEAAGQGLCAGLNAARIAHGLEPHVFPRSESYLGVMIDDIVGSGIDEPYRLFSSRSEFRLHHRQDNADIRLGPVAFELGLLDSDRMKLIEAKMSRISLLSDFLNKTRVDPQTSSEFLLAENSSPTEISLTLEKLLKRPEISLQALLSYFDRDGHFPYDEAAIQVEIETKYEGYIRRERNRLEQLKRFERLSIPEEIDYNLLETLSREARERLSAARPANLGQAFKIAGLSPSDQNALLVVISKLQKT